MTLKPVQETRSQERLLPKRLQKVGPGYDTCHTIPGLIVGYPNFFFRTCGRVTKTFGELTCVVPMMYTFNSKHIHFELS
ncbi:hypothetical protein EJ05DRAFT_481226 [Pseudovirgaria hyperparasitica]|uniref:Uncharacterized protein n=1 Tax=Pseudovirgaria hyperparasitica TaxID=470096 RepID=A0A6A6VRY6_9PEZI|nr:uncharacterized protein EJ05DRAFT_481226 [Pseudovirgaria hyperparasitica]KAF2752524.1 hypothetical protein EJ05DRAFT_481226 [Pseudovirgaria hyperparasitica]